VVIRIEKLRQVLLIKDKSKGTVKNFIAEMMFLRTHDKVLIMDQKNTLLIRLREDLHIRKKKYAGYNEKQSVFQIAVNKNSVFTLLYHL